MKQLNFKSIKATNFFCFGNKGVEINFDSYENIVLIKGINQDVIDQNGKFSSNGSGKSSIPQIITYCFYGKTIKSPKKIGHKDIINNKNGKKLSVEVIFDEYKIVRTRKPDSLKIWKSKDGIWDDTTEITLGGMPATQELINNIIGLSYESFLNVCVFTDDNNSCFLELDPAEKRKIVENLLNLEKYRNYLEKAKELSKENKEKIKNFNLELSYVDSNKRNIEYNISNIKDNIKSFENNLKIAISNIEKNIENLKLKIKDSSYAEDLKKYEEAQEKIKKLEESLESLNSKKDEISIRNTELFKVYNEKLSDKTNLEINIREIATNINIIENNIKILKENIERFENLDPNMKCDKCYGTIKPENYKDFLDKAILSRQKFEKEGSDYQLKLNELNHEHSSVVGFMKELTEKINKIKDFSAKISVEENKIKLAKSSLSNIKKPEQSNQELIIQTQIENYEKEKEEKLAQLSGKNPNQDLLDKNNDKLAEVIESEKTIKNEIQNLEILNNYFEFWFEAFGDEGIRKLVVNEIIPALNSRLSYWLQILIDNKIDIKFDSSLNEFISKFPDKDKELIYPVLSNGQKRRINLAVNQAFAHVMMLSHGVMPNIIFLDEVTSNIDSLGVQAIYNMICELSKNKKVFVTTHDQDLISMLNGCQEITLEMKNGESSLK